MGEGETHTHTHRGAGGERENEHEIMCLLKLGHETITLLGIYLKEIIRNGLTDVSTGCSLQQYA